MLAQRILGIALGYEDLNDHQSLREDPLFAILSERGIKDDLPLASPPTLCRLENRVHREALARIAEVLVEAFISSHATAPDELILDFDPTDDPVHGNQEKRFFHGYYDHYCFLPLYVFCEGQLLVAYLRPSNIDPALHSRAILKLLVERFRRQWPNVKIVFRGDSGLCRWRLMRWCDKHNVGYIIGMIGNSVLEKLARPWMDASAKQFAQTGQKQRFFGEFSYAAGTWDKERRVIVKAEYPRKGPVGLQQLANAQVGTIRLKLLKIGARVVSSVRRIVFHLAGGYPLKDLFTRILGRLSELSVKSIAFG
jgi:hypothetical protein